MQRAARLALIDGVVGRLILRYRLRPTMKSSSAIDSAALATETTRHASRRDALLRWGLVAYALTILGIGWSYGFWQLQRDRAATLQAAHAQLRVISTSFNNHVQAIINDGVGGAIAATNELQANISRGVGGLDAPEAVLRRMLTGGDYVHGLFIATTSSFHVATRGSQTNDLHQSLWLDELRKASASTWVHPQKTTAQGGSLFAVARRVPGSTAEPMWAGALFTVDALSALYEAMAVEGGSVSLVTRSGVVLLRVPEGKPPYAGLNVSSWEVYRRALSSPGGALLEEVHPLQHAPWLFVASPVAGYDLFTVAAQERRAAFAGWFRRVIAAAALALAMTAAAFALAILLYRAVRREYAALRESEERFQLAIAGTNEGIWDWDLVRARVYYSPRFHRLLEYDDHELSSSETTFWKLLHPDDRAGVEHALDNHLHRREPFDVRYRLRTRSGEYRWFRGKGEAIWSSDRPIRMAGSISDIHAGVEMEQSLAAAQREALRISEEFAQHLLDAQEQERKRIAQELHDTLGQNLSLIANRAQLALRSETLASEARRQLNSIVHVASEAIDEVRSLVRNLLPLHIEQAGISAALRALAEQVAEVAPLRVESRIDDVDDALSGASATHVYRIVQEGFSNILKHAAAKSARLEIERDLHSIRVRLQDDGKGVDLLGATKRGVGLTGISERARLLGGSLRIESRANGGTLLEVELPVPEAAAAENDTDLPVGTATG